MELTAGSKAGGGVAVSEHEPLLARMCEYNEGVSTLHGGVEGCNPNVTPNTAHTPAQARGFMHTPPHAHAAASSGFCRHELCAPLELQSAAQRKVVRRPAGVGNAGKVGDRPRVEGQV